MAEAHTEDVAAINRSNTALDKYLATYKDIYNLEKNPPPYISPDDQEIQKAFAYVAAEAQYTFGKGVSDGILGALSGDDFQKAWSKVWEANAKMAGKMLEDVFTGLQKGKSLTGALQGAGLMDASGNVNYGAALGAGGGMVSSYASQQGNQGLGAAGGAMSGAAAGIPFGPWGIVIGAIIGGVMGYFGSSSGQKSYGYNVTAGSGAAAQHPGDVGYYFTAGNAGVGFNYGGPSTDQMKDFAKQLSDVVNTTTASMRDLLVTMKQPLASPTFSGSWTGSTTDAGTVMTQILQSSAPMMVFNAFKPYLQTGLESLGVSTGRAVAELATFDTSKFDTALAAFQAWVGAIVNLQTVVTNLKQPFADLQASLTLTIRDAFMKNVGDAITQIGVLSDSLDQLTTPEQVARAGDIVTQANAAISAIDTYIANLAAAQAQYNAATTTQTTSWAEQTAKEKGPDALVSFYEDKLTDLQNQLNGMLAQQHGLGVAGAPMPSQEDVQAIYNQILQYTNSLWQMNAPAGMYSSTRTDAQNYLDAAKKTTDLLFAGFNDEAQKERDLLKDSTDAIITALRQVTGSASAVVPPIDDLGDSAGTAADKFRKLNDASDGLISAFYALSDAAAAAGGFASAQSLGRQA
jgi:hypothetical protein